MKASDVPDHAVMVAVQTGSIDRLGATTTFIESQLPDFPPKVIRAKLRALLRRGLITGCICGCRGDFNLTPRAHSQIGKA